MKLDKETPTNVKDMTGEKIGRLNITGFSHIKNSHAWWNCKCDCGKNIVARGYTMRLGKKLSCGCLQKERSTTHGFHGHEIYERWISMINRCGNHENSSYKYYGARGIRVCDRWKNIKYFIEDMYPSYKKELTLDRIDNDGNYEPSNCRWATREEQSFNKRTTRKVTINGVTKALGVWIKQLGLNKGTVGNRIHRGWSIEEALEIRKVL